MSLIETEYEHIVLDEKGIAIIEGTSMKVIELVMEKLVYGWSPEELHFQHPYLTLGQIHSAFAYYWDHSEEIDKEISDRLKNVEKLRKKAGCAHSTSNYTWASNEKNRCSHTSGGLCKHIV